MEKLGDSDKINLALLVRDHPVIWQTTHEWHRKVGPCQEAWNSISAEIGFSATACKEAWRSLRDALRYQRKIIADAAAARIKKVKGQGHKDDENVEVRPGPEEMEQLKQWKFWGAMNFMLETENSSRANLLTDEIKTETVTPTSEKITANKIKKAKVGKPPKPKISDGIKFKVAVLVGKHPCIWNSSHEGYRKTAAAWKTISDKVGLSPAKCQDCWKNLKDCYRYHQRSDPGSVSSWKFWNVMKFLDGDVDAKMEGLEQEFQEDSFIDNDNCRENEFSTNFIKVEEDVCHEKENCLICYSEISPEEKMCPVPAPATTIKVKTEPGTRPTSSYLNDGIGNGTQFPKLSQQLRVIFLLRNILQVPSAKLQQYLRQFNLSSRKTCNPDSWIKLCTNCNVIVTEALEIHGEIRKSVQRFKKVKQKIIESVLNSSNHQQTERIDNDFNQVSHQVTNECRRYVETHYLNDDHQQHLDYENSFILGDLKATEDLQELKRSSKSKPNSQTDISFSFNDHDDDDFERQEFPTLSPQLVENDNDPVTPTRVSRRIFQCNICPAEGSKSSKRKNMSMDEFLQHYLFHSKFVHKCTKCSKRFFKSTWCLNHYRRNHPEPEEIAQTRTRASQCVEDASLPDCPWWCPHCDLQFFDDISRDNHIQLEHGEMSLVASTSTSHKCQFCSKEFYCPDELKMHQGTVHVTQLEVIVCPKCGSSFRNDPELKDHLRKVHRIQRHVCHVCGQECANSRTFQNHLQLHKEKRKHQCPHCPQTFWRSAMLTNHICRMHTDASSQSQSQNPLMCPHCKKIFNCKPYLRQHIRQIHLRIYEISCDLCGRGVQNNAKLKRHLAQTHKIGNHGKKLCPEDGCDKYFFCNWSLRQHIRRQHGNGSHHGLLEGSSDPELFCAYCSKRFYDRSQLRRHEQIHENAETKPFQCEICAKRFPVRNYLYIHMRSHKK